MEGQKFRGQPFGLPPVNLPALAQRLEHLFSEHYYSRTLCNACQAKIAKAPGTGLEPVSFRTLNRCSLQLSYPGIKQHAQPVQSIHGNGSNPAIAPTQSYHTFALFPPPCKNSFTGYFSTAFRAELRSPSLSAFRCA